MGPRVVRRACARRTFCHSAGTDGQAGDWRPVLEQIGVDGIAVGDTINRVNLLYFIDVDRIHRMGHAKIGTRARVPAIAHTVDRRNPRSRRPVRGKIIPGALDFGPGSVYLHAELGTHSE